MLDFDFDTSTANRMKGLGCDPSLIFSSMESFDLAESLETFKPQGKYYKPKVIPNTEQQDLMEELLDDPLSGNGIISISSFPTDLRAKIAALHVFRNAMIDATNKPRKPRWITLYSDRLDYEKIKAKRPSMLFISNVNMDSTQYKLERLRDIIEMFPDIPRVIVTGGDPDATELAVKRLRLALNGAVSIGPKHVVANVLELMDL